MKYKILLMGRNNTMIDEFFAQMTDSFECMYTSSRYEDIISHMKYFGPDALVFCLNDESRTHISQMVAIKNKFEDSIQFIIIGDDEQCLEFERIAVNVVDLALFKPITPNSIRERIVKLLENSRRKKLEIQAKLKAEKMAAEQAAAESENSKDNDGRKHILVIDDDPTMLKIIKTHLHDEYDVATAINGKIALKFLEKKKTNLILLDYEMPEENGPAVLEKIRANDALKDIPVIFLTGITEKEKIQIALSLKPQGYLLKPIDRDKLISTIRKFAK